MSIEESKRICYRLLQCRCSEKERKENRGRRASCLSAIAAVYCEREERERERALICCGDCLLRVCGMLLGCT